MGETWEKREGAQENKSQTERIGEMKRAGVLFIHLPLH